MSRLISRAEGFERVYEAFNTVNFAAFDYNTVKQSLLDYLKLSFPESFNDFIETDELIAIIETFAYIAELLAYRIDVAAHENFITTAQRKDSILRLAKLISYTPSRPLPARGLVKLTSVSTSESVTDANGAELANVSIRWNDVSNPAWKEQFILVLNRVLDQEIGNVSPNDRFQIQDVLFELYSFKNNPIRNGVFSFNANANGRSVPMELVPVQYSEAEGIIERRPTNNSRFTLLYGVDGLGDGSPTTGFFAFAKQGTLQKFNTVFDGITPTQKYDVPAVNVNDTDVWVNQINPTTGEILDEDNESLATIYSRQAKDLGKSGEWVPVDLAYSQNITFNTNPKRNKYEVETQDNNQVRLIFGDGEFANVPGGTFDIWVRTSLDEDISIPVSAVVDVQTSFSYVDSSNQSQTCTFTFSLVNSLQNASASETLEHVRSVAPGVYYTQDRMVNGKDYNVFMLQDPSILKLRSVNRTFVGDSRYIAWHDPSSTYENVKLFGTDGALYLEDTPISETTVDVSPSTLIDAYLQPLLSSTDLFVRLVSEGIDPINIRRQFTPQEKQSIIDALNDSGNPASISLYFRKTDSTWFAIEGIDGSSPGVNPAVDLGVGATNAAGDLTTDYWVAGPSNPFISSALITTYQISSLQSKYVVTRLARRTTFESPTTQFWTTNDGNAVVNYDSLRTENDQIVILKPNINHTRSALMSDNWKFDVLGRSTYDVGPEAGLPDDSKLVIISTDENGDRIPDSINILYPNTNGLADILRPKVPVTVPNAATLQLVTMPIPYIVGIDAADITVQYADTGEFVSDPNLIVTLGTGPITDEVYITNTTGDDVDLIVSVQDYLYFTRTSVSEPYQLAPTTINSMSAFYEEYLTSPLPSEAVWKRHPGRSELNFMWTHTTPRYYLVDPSPTNIIDTFVITKSYFNNFRRWIQDSTATAPRAPTPLDLRTSYGYMLDNKMISDTVVLHPGRLKLILGDKARPELRGKIKVIRSDASTSTDTQIKSTIVATARNFFDITKWEFGETFYVTELIAAIHNALRTEISSAVIVPSSAQSQFGDLFQIECQEDEIFYIDINVEDVEIVSAYTPVNLRLNA
jgi:hypothetical protein